MTVVVDPRTKPSPPYRGPERSLAREDNEIAGLVTACKQGRLYDAEAWVREGRPLQMDPRSIQRPRRRTTPLSVAIATGQFDLVRLLLCNGYRTDLEPSSPLDAVLDARRWDLLELLLKWGTDPHGADLGRVFDTYQTAVFERFYAAAVDLTAGDAMADSLANSSSNRPLYGFARARREDDSRIQRALDVALGAAIRKGNDKAVSLCLWSGANPRRRVGEIGDDPAEDADGLTALERAVSADAPAYLKKLGVDESQDNFEALYRYVHSLETLRSLAALHPPENWHRVTMRFLDHMALSVRLSLHMTSLWEVGQVFGLGGRLGALDAHEKRTLRHLLLALDDHEAQHLLRLLRDPENMERSAFLDLIAHEKLAARYAPWSWHAGVGRAIWAELERMPGVPGAVRRIARQCLTPTRNVAAEAWFEEMGTTRLISREELYDLVWSEPLLTLARRFGLSDNGLRKRCKAMQVPTPAPGYWQRFSAGRPIKRTPLPPLR